MHLPVVGPTHDVPGDSHVGQPAAGTVAGLVVSMQVRPKVVDTFTLATAHAPEPHGLVGTDRDGVSSTTSQSHCQHTSVVTNHRPFADALATVPLAQDAVIAWLTNVRPSDVNAMSITRPS